MFHPGAHQRCPGGTNSSKGRTARASLNWSISLRVMVKWSALSMLSIITRDQPTARAKILVSISRNSRHRRTFCASSLRPSVNLDRNQHLRCHFHAAIAPEEREAKERPKPPFPRNEVQQKQGVRKAFCAFGHFEHSQTAIADGYSCRGFTNTFEWPGWGG